MLSDIADIARNIISGYGPGSHLGYPQENIRHIPILSMNELMTRYYLRFEAQDHPGCWLPDYRHLQGEQNQHQLPCSGGAQCPAGLSVVMITHVAKRNGSQRAKPDPRKPNCVVKRPMVIRIEDEAQ